MQEILRDPVWQFIGGAVLGLMAIFIPILLYLKQRSRKSLSYEIITYTPLINMAEKLKGTLQILFNGKEVNDVNLLKIRIINTGNIPITSKDYEVPISLNLGQNSQILTADILETNPEALKPSINIENSRVLLEPLLLNSSDFITFKLLVSQPDEKIDFGGRIVGVKTLTRYKEKRRGLFFSVIGAILTLVGIQIFGTTSSRFGSFLILIGFCLMIFGVVVDPFASFFRRGRFKKWAGVKEDV